MLPAGVVAVGLVEDEVLDGEPRVNIKVAGGRLDKDKVTAGARFSIPKGSNGFLSSITSRFSASTMTSNSPAAGSATALESAERAKMVESRAEMCMMVPVGLMEGRLMSLGMQRSGSFAENEWKEERSDGGVTRT